eukprot:3844925-Rhodomonas_salina.2
MRGVMRGRSSLHLGLERVAIAYEVPLVQYHPRPPATQRLITHTSRSHRALLHNNTHSAAWV